MTDFFLMGHSKNMECLRLHPWPLMLATKLSIPYPWHSVLANCQGESPELECPNQCTVAVSSLSFQVIPYPPITGAAWHSQRLLEPAFDICLPEQQRQIENVHRWEMKTLNEVGRSKRDWFTWEYQRRKETPNLFRYFRVIKKTIIMAFC